MNNKRTNKNLTSHNNNCIKFVGANCVRPNSNGITLIALIITIIVMLILVGVTITVALDTGLFDKAKEGAKGTEVEADRETLLGAVTASVDTNNDLQIPDAETLQGNLPAGWGVTGTGPYTAISPSPRNNEFKVYKNGKIKEPIELPEGEDWNEDAISEIITETVAGVEYKVPIPEGYVASKATGESTVAEGLVIYEGTEEVNDSNVEEARKTKNQFVWIPVSGKFINPYGSSEPKALNSTYDSQDTLNEYYGTKEDGSTPFYNYATDFAYATHYAEMVESVNKYHGFYIGRYETTIDVDENNEIGSKYDKPVLTANKTIPQTNNKQCLWYGLYYTQRNSNVVGNNDYLQTNMIWGQQWDAMIKYFGGKDTTWGLSTQGRVVNSGQSTNKNNSSENDKIYNIYDLRTNCYDWTAEAVGDGHRTDRGGNYDTIVPASRKYFSSPPVYVDDSSSSSRLTLYIK